jgi:hypothetical protein
MSQKQATDPVREGTPGTRVKAAWSRSGGGASLKAWTRQVASLSEDSTLQADAKQWLASKRHGGTDEQRNERKLLRRERRSANATAAAAKKSKGSNKQGSGKKKKGTSDDSR